MKYGKLSFMKSKDKEIEKKEGIQPSFPVPKLDNDFAQGEKGE